LIARKKFPGSPASLDALCRRFGITSFERDLHGALLDSEILAEVYLELIGGRQPDFGLATVSSSTSGESGGAWTPSQRPSPLPSRLSASEAENHKAYVAKELGDAALWLKS
jgi:DNA polymerase-3 subunit epsilon